MILSYKMPRKAQSVIHSQITSIILSKMALINKLSYLVKCFVIYL